MCDNRSTPLSMIGRPGGGGGRAASVKGPSRKHPVCRTGASGSVQGTDTVCVRGGGHLLGERGGRGKPKARQGEVTYRHRGCRCGRQSCWRGRRERWTGASNTLLDAVSWACPERHGRARVSVRERGRECVGMRDAGGSGVFTASIQAQLVFVRPHSALRGPPLWLSCGLSCGEQPRNESTPKEASVSAEDAAWTARGEASLASFDGCRPWPVCETREKDAEIFPDGC